MRAWSQDGGADELVETQELLAVPPLVTIPPGERQIVRIGHLATPSPDLEKSFRVIVTELPPNAGGGSGSALSMRLRLSIPVFVAPGYGTAAPDGSTSRKVLTVGVSDVICATLSMPDHARRGGPAVRPDHAAGEQQPLAGFARRGDGGARGEPLEGALVDRFAAFTAMEIGTGLAGERAGDQTEGEAGSAHPDSEGRGASFDAGAVREV